MAGRGAFPPVFSYQGETKELRKNGLYQGDALDLARGKAKKKQRKDEKAVWKVGRGGFWFRTRAGLCQQFTMHDAM